MQKYGKEWFDIYNKYNSGESFQTIANVYGLSNTRIREIYNMVALLQRNKTEDNDYYKLYTLLDYNDKMVNLLVGAKYDIDKLIRLYNTDNLMRNLYTINNLGKTSVLKIIEKISTLIINKKDGIK